MAVRGSGVWGLRVRHSATDCEMGTCFAGCGFVCREGGREVPLGGLEEALLNDMAWALYVSLG